MEIPPDDAFVTEALSGLSRWQRRIWSRRIRRDVKNPKSLFNRYVDNDGPKASGMLVVARAAPRHGFWLSMLALYGAVHRGSTHWLAVVAVVLAVAGGGFCIVQARRASAEAKRYRATRTESEALQTTTAPGPVGSDSPPVGWAQSSDLPPGSSGSRLSGRRIIALTGFACFAAGGVLGIIGLALGSNTPPPPASSYDAEGGFLSNLGSQEFLVTLLTSAEKTAEAEHAPTFASVTTTELGSALSGISTMTGAVTEPSEVSVDICADAAPCETIELASLAITGTCWLARATMTGPSDYLVAVGRSQSATCSAGAPGSPTVPASGWLTNFPTS